MERDKLACVTKFMRSRMPRPTSSQTQCSVWEVWKKTRTNLGKRQFIGILRIII